MLYLESDWQKLISELTLTSYHYYIMKSFDRVIAELHGISISKKSLETGRRSVAEKRNKISIINN